MGFFSSENSDHFVKVVNVIALKLKKAAEEGHSTLQIVLTASDHGQKHLVLKKGIGQDLHGR